tara:strand:- start:84 stop:326 length:243 start_codon:yes stop_codon:yes gene_type:complete
MIFPKILIITSVIFIGGCITNADIASDPSLRHKATLPTPEESGYWDRKEQHASLKHVLNLENSSSSNFPSGNRSNKTKQK